MRRIHSYFFLPSIALAMAAAQVVTLSCFCQEQSYLYEGKTISKQQYDAIELVNRGRELLNQGNYKELLEVAQKAVNLAPDLELTQAIYGTALSKAGHLEEARDHLLKAISIDDNRPGAWISLGAVYNSLGNNTEALKCYQTFLKKFPDDSHVDMVKSIVELSQKADDDSAKDNGTDYFAIACGSDPCRWPADQMPIAVNIATGNGAHGYRPEFAAIVKQACADWAKASANKVSFRFVESAEQAKIKVSWTDKASDLLKAGSASECKVTKNGDVIRAATIKLLTVDAEAESVKTEKMQNLALNQIGAALGITRNSPSPHDTMYFGATVDNHNAVISERDAKTIQRLYSAVEKASYSGLNQRAMTAMNAGDLSTAVNLLTEAHKLYPAMEVLADNLSIALYNSGLKELNAGQYEKAIEFYQKALALKPKYKSALSDMGACYFNLGVNAQNKTDTAGALPLYQKAIPFLEQGQNNELLTRAVNNCIDILKLQGKGTDAQALLLKYSSVLLLKK